MQRESINHSMEAEAAVLGSLIQSPERIDSVMEWLRPEAFSCASYGNVYAAMLAINTEGIPIDLLLLRDRLEAKNQLKAVGGAAGLAELTETVPTGVHLEQYAKIVTENWRIRMIREMCAEAIAEIDDKEDIQSVAGKLQARIDDVMADNNQGATKISEIANREIKPTKRIKTGFFGIDVATNGGLAPTDFMVIGARPGVGKSQFGLQILSDATLTELDGTERRAIGLFISLEMSEEELECRLIARLSKIPLAAAIALHNKRGTIETTSKFADRFRHARSKLRKEEYLIDTRPITVMGLAGLIARHRREIDFIVLDYLQLLSPTERGQREYETVTEASRMTKTLCQRYRIPVIALSQLSRPRKGEGHRKPEISDLRASGQIEQDANQIILLHMNGDDYGSVVEILVMLKKNRNGQVCEDSYRFNRELGIFSPMTSDDYEEM